MLYFLDKLFKSDIDGNAWETTWQLIQLLDIKVSRKTLKRQIEQHSDYPSLLSISDILGNYGIENMAFILSLEKFVDISSPFITQITNKRGVSFFTVVKEVDINSVHFFDPEKHKWGESDLNVFLKKCTDVVLLAYPLNTVEL